MNYLLRHEAAIDLILALGVEDGTPQRLPSAGSLGAIDHLARSYLSVSVLTAALRYDSLKVPLCDR